MQSLLDLSFLNQLLFDGQEKKGKKIVSYVFIRVN